MEEGEQIDRSLLVAEIGQMFRVEDVERDKQQKGLCLMVRQSLCP